MGICSQNLSPAPQVFIEAYSKIPSVLLQQQFCLAMEGPQGFAPISIYIGCELPAEEAEVREANETAKTVAPPTSSAAGMIP